MRTPTLARWAREGRISAAKTPFGHRRYRRAEVAELNKADGLPPVSSEEARWVRDAVRLYEQGWSIRRVGEEFDLPYGKMRRILMRHTTLRSR